MLFKQIDSIERRKGMQRVTSFERSKQYIPNVVGLLGLYHGISHLAGRCECDEKLGKGRSSAAVCKQMKRRIDCRALRLLLRTRRIIKVP